MPSGIVVAGMGGGSGKSVVSVSLAAALDRRGRLVRCFKKGPDYIDASWLGLAAGRSCCNLDPYLMEKESLRNSFFEHSLGMERVVIEGNRGLFDGVDVEGGYSTAELARMLDLPVILVVDCTKTTRTVAAMVLGCREFEKELDIRGVVLNRIGTSRHEAIVRRSVEKYTGIPVLGAVPRRKKDFFPQRHLGITPTQEHGEADETIIGLADLAEDCLDLDAIEKCMVDIPAVGSANKPMEPTGGGDARKLRIGVIRDEAFQFYYPENLEALSCQGASIVEVNALHDKSLPELDGLYIGGGFPETSIKSLAANQSFRNSVREAAEAGLPIYAECGGLIYLGESMEIAGEDFPLVGVFPARFTLEKKPQAHGYTILKVEKENPFYPVGTEIKGHEFRYSKVVSWPRDSAHLVMEMERGVGFISKRDGLVKKNVLALYTHVHALATPQWVHGMVAAARQWKSRQ